MQEEQRMQFRILNLLCIALGYSALISASPVMGQQVVIQRPVRNAFSATTSISVPDRGSINIGGMQSAASSNSVFGPFPLTANSGFAASAGSMEARVWIHRPAEEDAALLQQAESRFGPLSPSARGDLARRILKTRTSAAGAGSSYPQFPDRPILAVPLPGSNR
jgi:hypothetical protein